MKYGWKYTGTIFVGLFLLLSPSLRGNELGRLDCEEHLAKLIYHIQRGSIGRSDNALDDFRRETPAGLHDPENPRGTFALESEVLQLFAVAPELRDVNAFARKWGMDPDQVTDLLTYYGTRIFYDDARVAGDLVPIFKRLSQVSREHYLGDPQDSEARHWLFYSVNVTHLSVPEMARVLGVSEGQVYRELSQLQISIPAQFGNKIPQATRLIEQGIPIDSVAQQLGVGRQALEFVLHHVGERSRAVTWDRLFPFQGDPEIESTVLVRLHDSGLTYQEMADRLNQFSGVIDPADPNFRTEKSVGHKLEKLGLTTLNNLGASSVFHPDYGFLKESGKLNVAIATRFIIDNRRMSDDWLANQLGVTVGGLKQFFERHHIVRTGESMTVKRAEKTTAQIEKYAAQREGVDLYLDWIERNPGKLPTNEDFGRDEGNIPLNRGRFFGQEVYAEGKTYRHLAIFEGREQALLAIKERAKQRGIRYLLLNEFQKGEFSERYKDALKAEGVDLYLDHWERQSKGEPSVLEVNPHRLFGLTKYNAKGIFRKHALASDPSEALLAIKARAKERGLPYKIMYDQIPDPISPALREELKREGAEVYVDWLERHEGALPTRADFNSSEGNIKVSHPRFFGTKPYGAGDANESQAIFKDKEEALFAIKAEALKRGVPFWMVTDIYRGTPSEALRNEWKKEAVQLYLRWMKDPANAGKTPAQHDFGAKPGQIPLAQTKLYGTGNYAEGSVSGHSRIFDSQEEALLVVREAALRENIPFLFVKEKFSLPPSPVIRRIFQEEALDLYSDWKKQNGGREPEKSDFGVGKNKVGIGDERFFGIGDYAPGGQYHDYRVFEDQADALAQMASRSATEN